MDLRRLEQTWNRLGKQDPLWAVLTHPEKKGGRWELADFLATGEKEITELLEDLRVQGLIPNSGVAVDFGCAVGRLTQPLARVFTTVYGIDIAASMIEKARELNRHGDGCRYILNGETSLPLETASVDFLLSNLVLQHMEPRYSKVYIGEFLRVLKPGGLAVFQMPDRLVKSGDGQAAARPQNWNLTPARLCRVLWRRLSRGENLLAGIGEPRIEMYGIARDEVVRIIEGHDAHMELCRDSEHAGPDWVAYQYVARKNTTGE